SDTADAVSLSSSTRQQQLSSINNLLQKSVVLFNKIFWVVSEGILHGLNLGSAARFPWIRL
ncbi:hypothetical protein C465_01304, partial [Halorubrum distributum JCM 9100]